MENLPKDQKVVDLLTKLKDSNGGYPSDMLAARRRKYLKQMANVGLGIGIGAGLKETAKGAGNGASTATTVGSKILETVLIAAITIEAGTATYLYRDKIANAIQSYISRPTVQEVASPPDKTSSTNPSLIESVGTSSVTMSATPSGTPSGTPSSSTSVADSNNKNNNGGANTSLNANATPNPNGNQGNQYGLTPKPVRTKENNGGSGTSGGGGGDANSNGGHNNKP